MRSIVVFVLLCACMMMVSSVSSQATEAVESCTALGKPGVCVRVSKCESAYRFIASSPSKETCKDANHICCFEPAVLSELSNPVAAAAQAKPGNKCSFWESGRGHRYGACCASGGKPARLLSMCPASQACCPQQAGADRKADITMMIHCPLNFMEMTVEQVENVSLLEMLRPAAQKVAAAAGAPAGSFAALTPAQLQKCKEDRARFLASKKKQAVQGTAGAADCVRRCAAELKQCSILQAQHGNSCAKSATACKSRCAANKKSKKAL